MFIGNVFRAKRNVKFEEIDGTRQLCRIQPFIFKDFPQNIPTCTDALLAAITTNAAQAPSAASVTSLSVVASTPKVTPPPKTTSVPIAGISLTTTVLTTATVIPESSFRPIVSSVVNSQSSSTVSVSRSTIQSSAPAAASTTLPEAAPTTTSAILLIQPSQPTAATESSANSGIATPSLHLSTDAKVAITTVVVLAALAIVVGALYILTRRKRMARAQRNANFAILNRNDNIDGGDETRLVMTGAGGGMSQRELGPNGYPEDVKMEDGSLLADAEVPGRLKAGAKHIPIITKASGSNSGGERAATAGSTTSPERGPSEAGTAQKKKIDLVSLPMPPTIAIARAIRTSSISQKSEKREERINALSMARTQSDDSKGSASPKIKKVETQSTGFDHKAQEIHLSDESRELSALTKEYEAERAERDKEKAGETKRCMKRDRKVEIQSPKLSALDSKEIGAAW